MAQFNVTLTNGGAGVLAKCIGGKQLVFTKMSMGDGRYSGQSQDAAALVSVKANLTIAKITVKDGTATIRSVLQYKSVETGFTWREIGLFARDPDTQAEVLYAYGNAGEQGDYIPGSSEATLDEKIINIRAMISSAANVTAVIDESLVFATQQDLSAHEDNTNIHVTAEQKASWDAKETPEGAQAKADQAKADAEAASIPLTAKGQANGVASLDGTGKVPSAQLPAMDYDPAGSAATVQTNLDAHTGNTGNPHSVTAAQVGAVPTAEKGAAGGVATLDGNGKIVAAQMPDTGGSAEEVQAHLDEHIADTVKHVTAAERTNWNSKAAGNHTHTAAQVGARPEDWLPTAAEINAVPTSRTVNGKALSTNISLTAADVEAATSGHTHTAAQVGAVPTTRTVNGKALSANISLTAADVGAAAKSTKTTQNISTSWTGSTAPYTQSISISGVTATNIVEISLTSTATASQAKQYQMLNLQDGGQAAGSITLRAFGKKNTATIPINVIVRGDI